MQRFWREATAMFVAAAALCLPVATPTSAGAQATPGEVRVCDVEVSAAGTVTAFVAAPELAADDVGALDAVVVSDAGDRQAVTAVAVDASDVELTLVVDTSAGQPPQRLRRVQSIAMELALRAPRDSALRLVAMGHPAAVAQAGTRDVLERVAAVGRLEAGGRRALYDALVLAMDTPRLQPHVRHHVVVVGAGDDQASSATLGDVIARSETVNAAVSFVWPATGRAQPRGLASLAAATGGVSIAVDDYGGPLQAAAAVLADVLHRYRLTFQRQDPASTTLTIQFPAAGADARATLHLPPAAVAAQPDRPNGMSTGEGAAQAPRQLPPDPAPQPLTLAAVATLALVVLALAATSTVLLTRRTVAGPTPVSVPPSPPRAAIGAAVGAAVAAVRAGAAAVGGGAAAVRAGAARVPRSAVIVGTGVRSAWAALATRLRRHDSPPRPRTPAWPELAAQIHREVGGDLAVLQAAAERIQAARDRTAAYERAAGLDGRLAAVTLTALPLAVAAIRQQLDPGYLAWLTAGPAGWLSLAATTTLTVVAALWLWRVAKPPFAASPRRWRAHASDAQRWSQTMATVERAWLYAVAGFDLRTALSRTLRGESLSARWLLDGLLTAGNAPDQQRLSPPAAPQDEGQLAVLLAEGSGASAVDVLGDVRACLHGKRMDDTDVQARTLPLATLVPFIVCVLPATLVAGLVGWS